MKKVFKKNQVIIAALVIMIVAAGYFSYSGISLMDQEIPLEEADTTDVLLESETGQPGEAVLTGSSGYVAQAKVSREQIRSQNKAALMEVINNDTLSEEEKQEAVSGMVTMTDLAEKEAAAEMLLEAKGFEDVVVNLTGETADVMVPSSELTDVQRAQIEDIVMRKAEVAGANIVITPMDTTQEE